MEPISPPLFTPHSSPCGASPGTQNQDNKNEQHQVINIYSSPNLNNNNNQNSIQNQHNVQDENIYINQFYQNYLLNGFEVELIPIGDKTNYFSDAFPSEIEHIINQDSYIKLINKLNKAYLQTPLYIATSILILASLGSVYPFILYHNYSLDLTCSFIVILYVVTLYMIYRTFYPPMINSIIKNDINEQLDKVNKKYSAMELSIEFKNGEQYGKTKDNLTVKIIVHPQKSTNVLENSNITPSTPQQPPPTPIDIVSILPVLPPPFILNPLPNSPSSISQQQSQQNRSFLIVSPKSLSGSPIINNNNNNQTKSPILTITPHSPLQLQIQQITTPKTTNQTTTTLVTIPAIEISEPIATL